MSMVAWLLAFVTAALVAIAVTWIMRRGSAPPPFALKGDFGLLTSIASVAAPGRQVWRESAL
jgi:hypothetical protein